MSAPEADKVTVRMLPGLAGVPAERWDALANPGGPSAPPWNPFVSHAFLFALEEAGCVSRRTGWLPVHLLLERGDGAAVAAVPCYLKSHSMGEYVFDHAFADAYERAGGRYYPKLQVSVPFTPVNGPRLLLAEGAVREQAEAVLAEGLRALRAETGASSIHATFLTEADSAALARAGFLSRIDKQFHWFNEGFASFEDFLDALASRKRKAIRRERREALADGITVELLTGSDITEAHWDAFFAFYMDTGSRKWGSPYLNRRFFSLVGERMASNILLVMAKRAGRYIAGAINFIGGDALYGRNWGCIEDHPFLHFELCYYQAIEYAIAKGLARVEAGAQGEHKLARGYRPVETRSALDFADAGFRRAVADYLARESRAVGAMNDALAEHLPFRRSGAQSEPLF